MVDIRRMIKGSPWTFDRIQLIFEHLKEEENPKSVVLNRLDVWMQLHEMTVRLMYERVVRDIGNFVETFAKSDLRNFTSVLKEYLWIRVAIVADALLIGNMKLQHKGGPLCWVHFKYENFATFCFICGGSSATQRSFVRICSMCRLMRLRNPMVLTCVQHHADNIIQLGLSGFGVKQCLTQLVQVVWMMEVGLLVPME